MSQNFECDNCGKVTSTKNHKPPPNWHVRDCACLCWSCRRQQRVDQRANDSSVSQVAAAAVDAIQPPGRDVEVFVRVVCTKVLTIDTCCTQEQPVRRWLDLGPRSQPQMQRTATTAEIFAGLDTLATVASAQSIATTPASAPSPTDPLRSFPMSVMRLNNTISHHTCHNQTPLGTAPARPLQTQLGSTSSLRRSLKPRVTCFVNDLNTAFRA